MIPKAIQWWIKTMKIHAVGLFSILTRQFHQEQDPCHP